MIYRFLPAGLFSLYVGLLSLFCYPLYKNMLYLIFAIIAILLFIISFYISFAK